MNVKYSFCIVIWHIIFRQLAARLHMWLCVEDCLSVLQKICFKAKTWNPSLEPNQFYVWSYEAVSTDCTCCTTLCTVVQCTLNCVQLYSRFLLNMKWILTCATCQLPGVKTWLVVSFYLTFILVTYYMQTKVKEKNNNNYYFLL